MSMTRKSVFLRLGVLLCLAGVMSLWIAANAEAQVAPVISYAAKFVCGATRSDTDVVRGLYGTAINIHNPLLQSPVTFTKKAVIALPERSKRRGPISDRVIETLKADEAMSVDCIDIRRLFGDVTIPAHFEGFLVIETPLSDLAEHPLDVVAKYTARHRTGTNTADPNIYDVETMDIETITPKRVQ